MKTRIELFKLHVDKFIPKDLDNKLLWLITGLLEENGELLQILRQKEYKNQDIDISHLKEELGDVLYFVIGLMNHFDLSLEEIMLNNIIKLNKRFPTGEYNIVDAIKKVDHE